MREPLSALSRALYDYFSQFIVWHASERIDARGQQSTRPALVTVIGREHYVETRRNYPIRGWIDAFRVARNELRGASTLVHIGPWIEPSRTVTFFEVDRRFDLTGGGAIFFVPESFLISRSMPLGGVAEVTRDGFRYFVSERGSSQVAGGLIRSPQHYAMAVGFGLDGEPLQIDREGTAIRVLHQLRRLKAADLPGFLNPLLPVAIGPKLISLARSTTVILVVYLLLVSGYLLAEGWWREKEISALGSQVNSLLVKQRSVAQLSAEVEGLNKVAAGRDPTFLFWEVLPIVWKSRGSISEVSMLDGEITVRGAAPVATDVLGALADHAGFVDARFVAPVRQTGEQQEFAISLRLKPTATGK